MGTPDLGKNMIRMIARQKQEIDQLKQIVTKLNEKNKELEKEIQELKEKQQLPTIH